MSRCGEPSFVVGLTGGIGSGKSTVAELLVRLGAALVDTDEIAHALTAPGGAAMPALCAAFGPGVQTEDGALDRAAMRQRVFAEPEARRQLEAILHPMIHAEAMAACAAARTPYVVLAVPLLVESGRYQACCDRILVVDCAEATQVERVMARSHLSADAVQAIMAAQASRSARLAAADDVLVNEGPRDGLLTQIAQLHAQYLDFAAKKLSGGH